MDFNNGFITLCSCGGVGVSEVSVSKHSVFGHAHVHACVQLSVVTTSIQRTNRSSAIYKTAVIKGLTQRFIKKKKKDSSVNMNFTIKSFLDFQPFSNIN